MQHDSDVSGMDARHAAISQLIQEDKLQQAIKAMRRYQGQDDYDEDV